MIDLGSQGLKVAKQGFGCMGISAFYSSAHTTSEEQGIQIIQQAIKSGVTLLDTAEIYGPYKNEQVVGKAIKDFKRDTIQIASKTGIDTETWKPNGSPEYVRKACERSLKNLDQQYIDLYYIHRIDTTIKIEDTIGELKKLVQEGKIKYIGLSEASASTIRRAHAVHPITAVQLEWSLWSRDVEEEIIPTCRELGIGIVAYSPLGRGFLTGSIKKKEDFGSDKDWRLIGQPRFKEENFQENLKFVEYVEKLAKEKGCTPGQLSLAWVMAQGKDVCPIPGTTNPKHLEENIKANSIQFSQDELKKLNENQTHSSVKGDRYDVGMATFKDN